MKWTLFVMVLLLGVPGGARPAAIPSSPLLALTGGGLGSSSRLVALEPRTLEPRGSLALPGWAFGREWARSPDDAHLALVPKPTETNERLFVIRVKGSLRILVRMPLPLGDVCRLAWPSPRRLLVVLTRPACYSAVASARIVVIDPVRAQVVARYPLSGPTTVVATAPTRGGLALLLAPSGRRSARLVLVRSTGRRTIRLPRLQTRPRPLDKSRLRNAIGVAVDDGSRRAYVVDPTAGVIEIKLTSGHVSVRKPTPGIPAGSLVQAVSVRPGLLAITGVRASGNHLRPLGLQLVDTREWHVRMVEPGATGIAVTGSTLLAFQPSFDQLARGTPPIGLRGYGLDGSIRFHTLAGRAILAAQAQHRYAYAAGPSRGKVSVVDISNGQVEAPHPEAMPISAAELL